MGCLAVSAAGQLLLTGYPHRGSRIRIISARPATRRERQEYVQVNVDDDVIPEFDFSRAIPSPFRHLARKGMRFHIVTDGAELPTYHVIARRRGRSWWIEIDEIDESGRPARWSTIETTARHVIAQSRGIDASDFDLVIDLPPIGSSL